MGLYTKLPDDLDEVDVIIAGGGTAGCVVAARLADADPNLSILIIEGGPDNFQNPTVVHPIFFLSHLMPTSRMTLFYKGSRSGFTADRDMTVPSGGVLGGGSSINMMMYTRPQRSDFEAWGTPGWSADDMLPYMKRLETYHGPGSKETHGDTGPIQVSGGTFRSQRYVDDFIQSISNFGWPEIEDLQNLDSINGVQRAMRYISPDGKRQDAAHAYLHPRLRDGRHPNLHVVVESQVDRVLFDNTKRASGVVFRPNPMHQPDAVSSPRTVKARKLVVVSCGALGTPLVLERSGVGNPDILRAAGVDLVADVPGVGREYEDHQVHVYPYRTSLGPEETADYITTGQVSPDELMQRNDKILGWNVQDVACKLRPRDADIAALGPEFEKAWKADFKDIPDKPMMLMAPIGARPHQHPPWPIHRQSPPSTPTPTPGATSTSPAPTPQDPLDFDTGFYADPHGLDLLKSRWAYKTQREIVRRMQTFRGELASGHPPFPSSSKAACAEVDAPLPTDTPNIEYSAEDDAWHSIATCKMAPREKNGVVDASLSVYGVEGLKIADLSIPPHNVGANTCNTAFAIGRKGSRTSSSRNWV
ncbi:putative glucose dehydrogenase [Mycena rebaudengoi]|nr:putative glucose dehydrogenase [Mycena rebaudengoi]